jgi:hypothetical protein
MERQVCGNCETWRQLLGDELILFDKEEVELMDGVPGKCKCCLPQWAKQKLKDSLWHDRLVASDSPMALLCGQWKANKQYGKRTKDNPPVR